MRGGFFALFPITLISLSLAFLFCVDVAILFISQREVNQLAERISESVAKILVKTSRQTGQSGDNLSYFEQLVRQEVNEIISHSKFSFISMPSNKNIVISYKPGDTPGHVNISIGRVLLNGESLGRLKCDHDPGCWATVAYFDSGNGNILTLANSVKVQFNLNQEIEPFTFFLGLFGSGASVSSKVYSTIQPRILFNLLDTSWSTVEGHTQFARAGRFASLPHYELDDNVALPDSALHCGPTNEHLNPDTNNSNQPPCRFKGLAEPIWNMWWYTRPRGSGEFVQTVGPFQILNTAFAFRTDPDDQAVFDIWSVTQLRGINQQVLQNNIDRENYLRYLLFNTLHYFNTQSTGDTFANAGVTLLTPRFQWQLHLDLHTQINRVFGQSHELVLENSNTQMGSLRQIPNKRRFVWNTRCFNLPNSTACIDFGLTSFLGFEIIQGNQGAGNITFTSRFLWPHFFLGTVRPEWCVDNPTRCAGAHFGNNNSDQPQTIDEWILNSNDGTIYRRYNNLRVPWLQTTRLGAETRLNYDCCTVLETGDSTTVRCNGAHFVQFSCPNETSYALVCMADRRMGGLLIFPDDNPYQDGRFLSSSLNFGNENSPRIHNPGLNFNSPNRPEQVAFCATNYNNGWFQGCPWLRSGCRYRVEGLNWQSNQNNPGSWRLTTNIRRNDEDSNPPIRHLMRLHSQAQLRLYSLVNANSRSQFAQELQRFGCVFPKACIVLPIRYEGRGETPTYLTQYPAFNRYISDYEPLQVPDLSGLTFQLDSSQQNNDPRLVFEETQPRTFNMLIENPNWLRERRFLNKGLLKAQSARNCFSSVCDISPGDRTSPTACPYQVGNHPWIIRSLCSHHSTENPPVCCRNRAGENAGLLTSQLSDVFFSGWPGSRDNISFSSAWENFRVPFPDSIWREYQGPEPLMSMLQGIASTYLLMKNELAIPGDLFGILPFAGSFVSSRLFIPPSDLTVGLPDLQGLNSNSFDQDYFGQIGEDPKTQNRLKAFLYASLPQDIENKPFVYHDRVQARYIIGAFPSITDSSETNLVRSLAVAGMFLKDLAKTRQVILPVFTDLLAFGTCDFGNIQQNRLSWQNIARCINHPNNRERINNRNADTFRCWAKELMYDLTGDTTYLSGCANQERPTHQGLIRFLAENNILPVFFVYNATAGGVPIVKTGNGCVYTREELKKRGLPTAFSREFDEAFGVDIGRSIQLARNQGGFGNVYWYTFGELERVLNEIGSEFIQLGHKCNLGLSDPGNSGDNTVTTRLSKFCNSQVNPVYANLPNLSPVGTHISRVDNYGLCGHRFPGANPANSSPHYDPQEGIPGRNQSDKFMCIALDYVAAGNNPNQSLVRFGASFLTFANLMNLGVSSNLRSWLDPTLRGSSHQNVGNRFFTRSHTNAVSLSFVPPIDITIAGGLKCNPDLSVEEQIKRVLERILARPRILFVNNYKDLND